MIESIQRLRLFQSTKGDCIALDTNVCTRIFGSRLVGLLCIGMLMLLCSSAAWAQALPPHDRQSKTQKRPKPRPKPRTSTWQKVKEGAAKAVPQPVKRAWERTQRNWNRTVAVWKAMQKLFAEDPKERKARLQRERQQRKRKKAQSADKAILRSVMLRWEQMIQRDACLAGAASACRGWAKIQPKQIAPWKQLRTILTQRKAWKKLSPICKILSKRKDRTPEDMLCWAKTLLHTQRPAEAAYAQMYKQYPQHPGVRLAVAKYANQHKNPQLAHQICSTMLRKHKSIGVLWLCLARTQEQLYRQRKRIATPSQKSNTPKSPSPKPTTSESLSPKPTPSKSPSSQATPSESPSSKPTPSKSPSLKPAKSESPPSQATLSESPSPKPTPSKSPPSQPKTIPSPEQARHLPRPQVSFTGDLNTVLQSYFQACKRGVRSACRDVLRLRPSGVKGLLWWSSATTRLNAQRISLNTTRQSCLWMGIQRACAALAKRSQKKAQFYETMQLWSRATWHYERSTQLVPKMYNYWNRLARFYQRRQQWDRQVHALQRSLQLKAHQPKIAFALAQAMQKQHKQYQKEILKHLRKACAHGIHHACKDVLPQR
ncbi:MAG: hypothetical protein AAGJ35_00605 [Myxococcota bacterium]